MSWGIHISAWYTWYTIPILHVSISCGPGLVPGMGCYILIYNQLIGTVECCICRPTGEIPRGTNSIHIAHQWKPKLYPARGIQCNSSEFWECLCSWQVFHWIECIIVYIWCAFVVDLNWWIKFLIIILQYVFFFQCLNLSEIKLPRIFINIYSLINFITET